MPGDAAGALSRSSVPAKAASGRPSPRERLLKAADELFYAEGVNSVGIDRVIERADVARASLYSTFGSKDELIRAYLQHRMSISKARLRAAVEAHDDPRERLLSVFDAQAAIFARSGYHGCPFNRASAEARPGTAAAEVPQEYRRWLTDLLQKLAAAAGAPDPELLGSQLHLLYDGGMQAANLDHNTAIAAASRAAAEALLDAALSSTSVGSSVGSAAVDSGCLAANGLCCCDDGKTASRADRGRARTGAGPASCHGEPRTAR
jgi:AcrR family transcriptional regulator